MAYSLEDLNEKQCNELEDDKSAIQKMSNGLHTYVLQALYPA